MSVGLACQHTCLWTLSTIPLTSLQGNSFEKLGRREQMFDNFQYKN